MRRRSLSLALGACYVEENREGSGCPDWRLLAWGTWRGPARRGVSGAIVEGSTLGVFGLVLSGKWGEISEAASYYSSPGPPGTVATGSVAQLPTLPPGAVACLPAGATSGVAETVGGAPGLVAADRGSEFYLHLWPGPCPLRL